MENMLKTRLFTLCLLPYVLLAKEPVKEQISSVYDDYIVRGNASVKKISSPSPFSLYPFVLWDYADDISSEDTPSAIKHWENLLQFIASNNIVRVITDIKDPSHFPFFGVSAPAPSFTNYAQKIPPSCELAVFFALDGFAWDSMPAPVPVPSILPSPYPMLPAYFLDLPLKMEWVKQMIALGVNIKEVVLDPQPAMVHGNVADYQLLIDFMDYFCTENNLDVRLGVTYGISERTPTYANLDTFPTDPGLGALPGNFPPLTSGYMAPEWRPTTTYPLLDHVYVQAYEPDIPYIFTLPNNPSLAASCLLSNFRGDPYVQGIGTISFSSSSKDVVGTNTVFSTGDPQTHLLQVIEDMPLGAMQAKVLTRIGIVSEDVAVTNTTLSLNSNPPFSGSNVPFYQTEIINKWIFPFTNPTVVNNIYIMFSFENLQNNNDPFFGTWSTSQFMAFLQSFYGQGQSELPIYMQDANTPIPMPNNFAIYDFNIFQQNIQN